MDKAHLTGVILDELARLYSDPDQRPAAAPAPNTKRGVDFYPCAPFIEALTFGARVFRNAHKFVPSLVRPRTFNGRIFFNKFWAPLPTPSLGDKLAVRDYAAERIGKGLLPPLLWQGTDIRELVHLRLGPARYVLKANHGSGFNRILILPNGSKSLDSIEELEATTKRWLASSYGLENGEWHYNGFPRKLMLESFLEFGNDGPPDDVKFYCFDGRVYLIHVDVDRFTAHKAGFYSRRWKHLPVGLTYPIAERPRPKNLDVMIVIAERIAADLEFARIDLYTDGADRICLGEITFFPGNASEVFSDPHFDLLLGSLFEKRARSDEVLERWFG